jgi:small subunit ribosomal protein S9
MEQTNSFKGIGKRKTSVAKVLLTEGSGICKVNNKIFETFFSGIGTDEKEFVKIPFLLVNLSNKYNINVKVKGGGITSQLEAIRLAIAKAISLINSEYRQIFSQKLFLRRDSRIKERRKLVKLLNIQNDKKNYGKKRFTSGMV